MVGVGRQCSSYVLFGVTGKNLEPFLDLCVSSLRRGHANLLCIVPILSDVPEGTMLAAALCLINQSDSPRLADVGLNQRAFVLPMALSSQTQTPSGVWWAASCKSDLSSRGPN